MVLCNIMLIPSRTRGLALITNKDILSTRDVHIHVDAYVDIICCIVY